MSMEEHGLFVGKQKIDILSIEKLWIRERGGYLDDIMLRVLVR